MAVRSDQACQVHFMVKKRVNLELARLGYSIASTSAIEWENGTARESTMFVGRKGLSFAYLKRSRVVAAEVARLSYNLRVHSSLRVRLEEAVERQKFMQRTPAMAVGIADRVWTWLELLGSPVWALGMRNHAT
jgi:hypothetical protein